VRLHHLLSHTSGIDVDTLAFWLFRFHPRYWPEAGVEPPAYVPGPLLASPGTTFRYANVGYTVLSLALERIARKPFPQVAREEVFAPLGMEATALEGAPGMPPRARGHGPPGEGPRYAEQKTTDVVGSGDAVTTVDDLLRWDEALYGTAFLSAAAKAAMFTPHARGDLGAYGYGWIVERTADGKPRFRHHGVGAGFRSYLSRREDLHLYVAVLMNREYKGVGPAVMALEQRLEAIVVEDHVGERQLSRGGRHQDTACVAARASR
jgi:CubicO group peptidase (beta-lactamase class C family)